jgi:hypothetical protein
MTAGSINDEQPWNDVASPNCRASFPFGVGYEATTITLSRETLPALVLHAWRFLPAGLSIAAKMRRP